MSDGSPTKEKKVREEKVPPGRFRKVIETEYQNNWCRLVARLVDGSRLFLDMVNIHTSSDRYWRNPRGKHKHKQKHNNKRTASK